MARTIELAYSRANVKCAIGENGDSSIFRLGHAFNQLLSENGAVPIFL